MDLGTAPQGEIPTVVLLGDTLTWVQPPLALLDMVDMLDSETAAEATALEPESTTYPALVKSRRNLQELAETRKNSQKTHRISQKLLKLL